MALKDLLLYLDTSPACATRIDAALALAREHGAVVTGLSVVTHGFYQPEQHQEEAELAALETLFRQKAAEAGVVATWQGVDLPVVGAGAGEVLIRYAHATDLVIVGQEHSTPSPNLLARLIVAAGRPVLIVPGAGAFPTAGTRVLVAWKAGREAARAVHDALPILKRAERVTLLTVGTRGKGNDPWTGIREHLQRHGVAAEAELLPATSMPLADTLLNRSYEGAYDLLVMGAFGTTRRGLHLGPAAAQILREMTLPVLMAH